MNVIIDGKEYVEKSDNNSGNWNSGYCNSGNSNSGNWNSGYCNSGNSNFGDRNSGYRNSGNWNSGDSNSGNWNSGYCNSGDRNSGNWNSGNRNSGYCNSDSPTLRFFNKDTKLKNLDTVKIPSYFYFNLTEWISVSEMTEEEKQRYPHYEFTTGFLRVYKYKEAWKNNFDKASKEDVALTLELPNFDYKVFEEISGITKEMIYSKLNGGK